MKRYKVYVYNTVDKFWDCYEVNAIDPVDARNVAVQRLVDETGHGLDVYEVTFYWNKPNKRTTQKVC